MMSHDLKKWDSVHHSTILEVTFFTEAGTIATTKKQEGLLFINEKQFFRSTCYYLNRVIFSSSEYYTAYREPIEKE